MEASYSPYQPPSSPLRDQAQNAVLQPASRWLRLANLLIDYAVFIGLVFALMFALAVLLEDADFNAFIESAWSNALGWGAYLGYYIAMEAALGRTVGKLITGTKVVSKDGGRARLSQVIGRTLARFIPFEPFSVLTEARLGWHDSLPGTVVVRCR